MKTILLTFIFIAPLFVNAQITDNFSDGNFTANPVWIGDGSQFTVNPSFQLQLNSSGTGKSYLALANNLSSLDTTEWRFWIHLNFSPSAQNYARVYLASDQSNLEGPLNGYYLQFGENLGNDAVELFNQSGTTSTSVCRGTNTQIANAFTLGVKITRNAGGIWNLYVDGAGGTNYLLEATGTDVSYTTSSFFGVVCAYTTTNATFFYFDDFSIPYMPDVAPPLISVVNVVDSVHLDVKFSEAVDQITTETSANYSVNNGIGSPSSVTRDVSDFSLAHLVFGSQFISGNTYTITVNNVRDISGNAIASNTSAMFTFYKPEAVAPMDIVINEVLFNAKTGGDEFIEIYNNSQKAIDLRNMKIAKEGLTTQILSTPVTITSSSHLFLPGQYLVLSDDFSKVKSEYGTPDLNAFLNMNVPDLLTDEDIILLLDSNSNVIDKIHYFSSWHFPMLNSVDGVSLERLNASRATQDQTNWHSAAETVGFATPGYRNSQYDNSTGNGDEIKVDPEIFSPDEDGHNDIVNVHYHFSNSGNVANVLVYDSKGRLIRNLVNNELLGNDGSFAWDGITNSKDKARIGMYIFYIEVYDINGDTKKFKKTCVLAGKL